MLLFSSPPGDPTPTPSTGYPIGLSQSIFSYEELAMATNGFSENNFIGQGGFGHVHKVVLPNEKVVAVKQLKLDSKQGEREFRAEVEVISRVHHKHLVSLVGYCISGEQRLLVYDFVPNGNLEYHLHGKSFSIISIFFWAISTNLSLYFKMVFAWNKGKRCLFILGDSFCLSLFILLEPIKNYKVS